MTLNSCCVFTYSIVERLNLKRGQNKLLPAQRAESVLSQRSSPHIMTGLVSLRRRLLVLILRCVNNVLLTCQAVNEKKVCKSSFFSFGKLLKLVLLLLVAAVAIDIYKHKGYKGTMLLVIFRLCAVGFVPF